MTNNCSGDMMGDALGLLSKSKIPFQIGFRVERLLNQTGSERSEGCLQRLKAQIPNPYPPVLLMARQS